MAFDISTTYTSFGDGISDDAFIWNTNSVEDMDWVSENMTQTSQWRYSTRYASIMEYPVKSFRYSNIGSPPTKVHSTPNWPFTWNITWVTNPTGWVILSGSNIDQMAHYGSSTGQVNYFFDRTAWIKVTNSDGTTVTTTVTTNYPNTSEEITAVGWHVTNLLFSKNNKIYYLDTVNNYINDSKVNTTVWATNWSTTITCNDTTGWNIGDKVKGTGFPTNATILSIVNNTSAIISLAYTWTTGSVKVWIWSDIWVVTITPWSIVKYIYSYSYDSTVVIAVNWSDTHIYELSFNGIWYSLVSKIIINWIIANDCYGDGYDVFFVSIYGLHQYQGRQHQLIKYKKWGFTMIGKTTLLSSQSNALILIKDQDIYYFGSILPWANRKLRKFSYTFSIVDVDWQYILADEQVTGYTHILGFWGAYRRTNSITLRPLDGWSFQTPKSELNYRFGYIFPKWDTTPETEKCKIVVKIMTDEMEIRSNPTVFLTIWSYELDSQWYIEIPPMEIVKALEIAGFKSEFWYVRTKIELWAGKEQVWQWVYAKTPLLFDFQINANYVKR